MANGIKKYLWWDSSKSEWVCETMAPEGALQMKREGFIIRDDCYDRKPFTMSELQDAYDMSMKNRKPKRGEY